MLNTLEVLLIYLRSCISLMGYYTAVFCLFVCLRAAFISLGSVRVSVYCIYNYGSEYS